MNAKAKQRKNQVYWFCLAGGKKSLLLGKADIRDSIKSKNFEEGGMGFGEGRGKLF